MKTCTQNVLKFLLRSKINNSFTNLHPIRHDFEKCSNCELFPRPVHLILFPGLIVLTPNGRPFFSDTDLLYIFSYIKYVDVLIRQRL